jgi:serine/threonine protein kinase
MQPPGEAQLPRQALAARAAQSRASVLPSASHCARLRAVSMPLTHRVDTPTQVNSDPKSALGTLAYTAPEALKHNYFEGAAADVWTCGVMLYTMLTGTCPAQLPL